MDQSLCAPGTAADHVMLYGDDFVQSACDVPYPFYVSFFSVLTILRLGLVLLQFRLWNIRERKLAARTGKTRKRFPAFVALSFMAWLALLLFAILTSLNVANAANGAPAFLLNLLYFPMAIQTLILMQRMVRLGRKLIPVQKLQIEAQNSTISGRLTNLSQTTWLIRVIYIIHVLTTVLTAASFVVGLFVPVYTTYQVGATGYALQDFLLGGGLVYQHQRVINVIRACQEAKPDNGSQASEGQQKLNDVILRMRIKQLIWSILAPAIALLWLISVARLVLPRYW